MEQTTWFFTEFDLDGYPLLLRYPEAFDFEACREVFPELLVITHTLKETSPLGLPETEYNKSLEDLDYFLTHMFEDKSLGKTVFIETFSGSRTYYYYISPQADLQLYSDYIKASFPDNELNWDLREDPNWHILDSIALTYQLY